MGSYPNLRLTCKLCQPVGPPPPSIEGCHITEKSGWLFSAYATLAFTETSTALSYSCRRATKEGDDKCFLA